MPLVSVVIPAFKREFLADAISSALTQTWTDLEVLVGDDTHGGRLREVVEAFDDPRVRYFAHGFGNAEKNLQQLWQHASGRYIKPLFDDDMLFPDSLSVLVAALERSPEASMAFHERVHVGPDNQIVHVPPKLLADGDTARLDYQALVDAMMPRLDNFIGEPSNTLINRDFADISSLYTYDGRILNFLGDVACYLNLARRGPICAVGGYLSAFRRHPGQTSDGHSPHFAAGLYEWELVARTEAAAGRLHGAALHQAWRSLRERYAWRARELPEIARFAAGLDELVTGEPADLLGPDFQARMELGEQSVTTRITTSRALDSPDPRCVICDVAVASWLPEMKTGGLAEHLGVIGTRGERLRCAHCGASGAERHNWHYMEAAGLTDGVALRRILHIAPPDGTARRFAALGPLEHVIVDPFAGPADPGHVDLTRLPFEDERFDLIICNDVLARIDFPDQALAEFARCLTPGGDLVVQTPYSPVMRNTLEFTVADDPLRALCGAGRSRIFGLDLLDRVRAAGFAGDARTHTAELGHLDPVVWGLDAAEPFLHFVNTTMAPDARAGSPVEAALTATSGAQ